MNKINQLVAGIGDYIISQTPGEILKTYSLGSCIAVMIYDQFKKTGGMIHIALPDSGIDLVKAGKLPGYFADSGLPVLINEIKKMGSLRHNLKTKIAGGANVMNKNFSFDIGKRNLLAARKILWKFGLGAIAEDVGGHISRTVTLFTGDGRVEISSAGRKWEI